MLKSISFSSLSDHKKCGWYFKLKHIKRLEAFTASIWTHYGTLVHKYLQLTIDDKMEPEVAAKKFIRTWFKFCSLYRKQLAEGLKKEEYKLPKSVSSPAELYAGPVRAIMAAKKLFSEKFGKFKVLYIEERLKESTNYEQYFGGYIDIVLELEDGSIIVADFKTCSSHFMFNKFRDKYKDYQLTFYKHFLCEKYGIEPKKVETYFITIAKDPKVKKSMEFIRITSGPKKVKNAFSWLNGVLAAAEKDIFVKNRSACLDFYGKPCSFYGSPHCP